MGLAGPYREFFHTVAAELRAGTSAASAGSRFLGLVLPTPNSFHHLGEGRALGQFHPGRTSPTALQLYEFVGRLLAIALRTRVLLRLDWCPFVWRQLCGEEVRRVDWLLVDRAWVTGVLDPLSDPALTVEVFEERFPAGTLTWSATGADPTQPPRPLAGHEHEV